MKNVNYNAGAACQSENFLLPRYLWKIIDYSLVEINGNVALCWRERQSLGERTPIACHDNANRLSRERQSPVARTSCAKNTAFSTCFISHVVI